MESPPADAVAVGPESTCRNCGAPAPGDFCGNCGQETRVALPKVGTFLREAAGRYVALDGRLLRTLIALVARPGFLTLEYFSGRRRRYIRPARLFLVLYLLLFALVGLLQQPKQFGDQISFVSSEELEKARASGALPPVESSTKDDSTGLRLSASTPPGDDGDGKSAGLEDDINIDVRVGDLVRALPTPLQGRYAEFKKLSTADQVERIYFGMLRYGPYAMVALLPAFALLLGLAYVGRASCYPGRPRRYAEHLVFAAHVHAFVALMLIALLLVPGDWAVTAMTLWMVYYVLRAQQVVYRGRWWAGMLRASFVATIYVVLLSLAIVGLLALAVMLR